MDEVLRLLQSLHTKIDAQQSQLGQLEETIEARLQPLERFFQQQQGLDGPGAVRRLPAGPQAVQLALQDGHSGGKQHLKAAEDGLAALGMAEAVEWAEEPAEPISRQQTASEAAAPAEAQQRPPAGRRLQPQQLQAQMEHSRQDTIPQEQQQQRRQDRLMGDPDTWHFFSLPRRQPGTHLAWQPCWY